MPGRWGAAYTSDNKKAKPFVQKKKEKDRDPRSSAPGGEKGTLEMVGPDGRGKNVEIKWAISGKTKKAP